MLVSLARDTERQLASDRQRQLQLVFGPDMRRVAVGYELADEPVVRHERNECESLHALGGHGGPERLVHLGLANVVDSDGSRIANLGRPGGMTFDGESILMSTPVTCTVSPGALRVWVPRDRPGLVAPKPPVNWARLRHLAGPARPQANQIQAPQ